MRLLTSLKVAHNRRLCIDRSLLQADYPDLDHISSHPHFVILVILSLEKLHRAHQRHHTVEHLRWYCFIAGMLQRFVNGDGADAMPQCKVLDPKARPLTFASGTVLQEAFQKLQREFESLAIVAAAQCTAEQFGHSSSQALLETYITSGTKRALDGDNDSVDDGLWKRQRLDTQNVAWSEESDNSFSRRSSLDALSPSSGSSMTSLSSSPGTPPTPTREHKASLSPMYPLTFIDSGSSITAAHGSVQPTLLTTPNKNATSYEHWITQYLLNLFFSADGGRLDEDVRQQATKVTGLTSRKLTYWWSNKRKRLGAELNQYRAWKQKRLARGLDVSYDLFHNDI